MKQAKKGIFSLFCKCLFFGIVAIFFLTIVCAIISISKNYGLPECDMPFFQFIFMVPAQEYLGVDFDTAQNIFLTLFACFFGVYWTVLGIILANKSISFVDFFIFTFNRLFCLNVIILSINLILFLFVYPLHIYTIAIEIAALVSYFQIIVCFFIAIKSTAGLQNYDTAVNLVVKKLMANVKKSRNHDKSKLLGSYLGFLSKCFPHNGMSVYIDAIKIISDSKEKDYEQIILLLFDFLCTIKVEEPSDCNLILDFFIRQIYTVRDNDQIDYNVLEQQINLFFRMYDSYLLTRKLSRSYIIEIRDSVYYLLVRDPTNQNIIEQYKRIIGNSFTLISNFLIHMDKRLALSHIGDFASMMQFLKGIPALQEVETIHARYIVDFAVLIVYLTLIRKISQDYLNYLETILSYIDVVIIDSTDRFFYPDLLEPNASFEVKYTRNFFIDLLFIYLTAQNGEALLKRLLDKCKYSIRSDGEYKDFIHYELLNHELKKVSNNDYILYGKITIEDCVKATKTVAECLEHKIAEIKKDNTEKIKQFCCTEKLEQWEKKEKSKIMEAIPGKFDASQKLAVKVYSAKITLAVSYRELMENSSLISFGTDYYNLYINWLYSIYLNLPNVKKKHITKLTDIKPQEEKITLLLPLEYHQYIYSNNIPEIKYSGSKVKIKNYTFDLEFIRLEKGALIVKEDFMRAFCIKDIRMGLANKQTIDHTEMCNVNVFIPAEIDFIFDLKSELYAYIL